MKRGFVLLAMLGAAATARAEEIVLDFEQAEIGKPMPSWTDKGVVVKLAGPLTQSKAAGRIMFFPHLATNHKGILNAMATEQAIPVQVTFPESASEVTLVVWGSTGCPALVEALDEKGEAARREVAAMHRVEAWRERLLDGGDAALAELLDEHPQADRQVLRQLVRNTLEERKRNKPPRAFRELYRELRELLVPGDDTTADGHEAVDGDPERDHD